jgi:hypothetical protein
MAWNDALEVIAGQTGQFYAAPLNTALPDAVDDELDAAFVGLGLISEDGVSFSQTPDITELRAWQERFPIRRIRNTETVNLGAALLQWNENNVPLALGGGAVTDDAGTGYRYDPPAPDEAVDERSFVLDVEDGDNRVRIVVPRGQAIETVEASFVRNALAELPITVGALAAEGQTAYYMLFNSDGFAPGS